MKTISKFQIILVSIALGHARPSDYDDLSPEKLSYGLKGTDQDEDYSNPSDAHNEPNAYYSTGIFTKYPDNPDDSESKEVKRSERKAEDQKISLRSYISSIESTLLSKAQAINANVRLRRSLSAKTVDEANSSENITTKDGLIDANKDLFEGLFEYTRAESRSSEENVKDIKIPLNGLVQAVETTFINSAQNLKDQEILNTAKRDTNSSDNPPSNRNSDVHSMETIQVKKITPLNGHDLNILKPIAFNAAASVNLPSIPDPISCNDELITTTEISPHQQSNLSVVHSSSTVHLVPDADQKLAHVQHQQIQQTVFHSSLAIFPTIPPQSINVPNLIKTTTQENVDDTTVTVHPITPIPEQMISVDLDKLKEKIAEIQAVPVILSQI